MPPSLHTYLWLFTGPHVIDHDSPFAQLVTANAFCPLEEMLLRKELNAFYLEEETLICKSKFAALWPWYLHMITCQKPVNMIDT